MSKECVLYEKVCSNCGKCLVCDMDDAKKCTNCGKCIDEVEEFRTVNIQEFLELQEDEDKFKK